MRSFLLISCSIEVGSLISTLFQLHLFFIVMKGSPVHEQQMGAMDGGASPAGGQQSIMRDCLHFLRTGTCRYGPNCRFSHPGQGLDFMQATSYASQMYEFPERIGQPDCQFYLKTGTCKFGPLCKYNHPLSKAGFARGPPLLNWVGLPMRTGEKECAFYLRTGSCKFGAACKFHHPDPTGAPLPSYPNNVTMSPAPTSTPTWRPIYFQGSGSLGSSSYMPMYPPSPQSFTFNGGWTAYQSMGAPPLMNGDPRGFFNGAQQQEAGMRPPPFDGPWSFSPSRPEQQDCQFYVQRGHCKFGASCKYRHPESLATPTVAPALSPMGLPLRQGQPICMFYLKNGVCKYGPVCRYDHPIRTSIQSPPAKETFNVEDDCTLLPLPKDGNGIDGLKETEDARQEGDHERKTENARD